MHPVAATGSPSVATDSAVDPPSRGVHVGPVPHVPGGWFLVGWLVGGRVKAGCGPPPPPPPPPPMAPRVARDGAAHRRVRLSAGSLRARVIATGHKAHPHPPGPHLLLAARARTARSRR